MFSSKKNNSFFRIPTVVFKDMTISAYAKLVFAFLIYNEEIKTRYKDTQWGKKFKKGDYIPLYQYYIAEAVGKSIESVRDYLKELISRGYLDKRLINGVKGTAQNTICEYRILWENIEKS